MSRLTRAQTLDNSQKRIEYFSDFKNNLTISPVGDQLARVTNDKSVIQALRNLILTKPGERLFNPVFGSTLSELLFEHNIEENLTLAEKFITDSIRRFEPRVEIIKLRITPNQNNENEIFVTLYFRIINNEEPNTVTFLFKRVR